MSKYYPYFTSRVQSLVATRDYHKANAFGLALFSKLSYASAKTAKKYSQAWGFENFVLLDKRKGIDIDTQCIVSSNDTDIVIAFRGSEKKAADWLANFQAVREAGPLKNTKAHEGFQDAFFPMAVGLANTVDAMRNKNQRIWFTGHSLGGALASLAAGIMAENAYSVYGLYTFASPRPGDTEFAKQLNKAIKGPHYRVVNSLDVVPHVPPEPFFSHAGSRRILKADIVETTPNSWWEERTQALRRFVNESMGVFDVADNHVLESTGKDDRKTYLYRLLADLNRDN